MLGLKVLKPQEALVLTLFGKYIGTLKGEGFYFVNPFCTGVNPAANTKLSQSADVDSGSGKAVLNAALSGVNPVTVLNETTGKKMSLNDALERAPEDQRLPRQPCRDRDRGHVACRGHGEGRLQCR